MAITFTDRQLDIMNILWDHGSATVREAKDEIEEDLAYTSVLTVFQTLEEHGHVEHEREGKAYRYFPTVSREKAGQQAAEYVLNRLFKGSGTTMTKTVLETADFDESEAESILDTLKRDTSVEA